MRLSCLLFGLFAPFFLFAQGLNVQLRSKLSFPGQTLANVWGYTAPDGREYALVGASKGLIIIDITNPAQPKQIVQIPGPDNLWKEIKTYKHFAYIVSEGGLGVQIVDLSGLPSPSLNHKYYTGDDSVAGQVNRIHALHVDTTQGYLYAYGGDQFGGGARAFYLKADPYNPVFQGKFDALGYVHDGYVDDDTLFSSHIYAGQFAIVDMKDKSNPVVLATQTTPSAFTHNTWLSADRHTLLTTDERNNSFLAAYDISDPTDIHFLDAIQSNPGSNSVVHNTHINGQFAVTSWYKDGYTIVDISRPNNLVQVGNFDTYAGSGSGFEGCWGVYPLFPSGTVIASNINGFNVSGGELYITTPTYVKACHFEGRVISATTGQPVSGAQVTLPGTDMQQQTAADGSFRLGTSKEGLYTVQITHPDYLPFSEEITLKNGQVSTMEAVLYKPGSLTITGRVVRAKDLKPAAYTKVYLVGNYQTLKTGADLDGNFIFTNVEPGRYELIATKTKAGTSVLHELSLTTDSSFYLTLIGFGRSANELLQARPNPFVGTTTLFVESPLETDGLLQLYSLDGRMVYEQPIAAGTDQMDIPAELQPGIYTVRLTEAEEVLATLRLVKLAD